MTTTKATEAPRFDAAIRVLVEGGHWHPARLYRNLTEQQVTDLLATEGAAPAALQPLLDGTGLQVVTQPTDTTRVYVIRTGVIR